MKKMDNPSLQILFVEDNPAEVYLLQRMLKSVSTVTFVLTHVKRLDAGLELLDTQRFDAVLLDLGLPDSKGVATLNKMRTFHPYVPIIVLSGLDDENIAVGAVRDGAQDYLVKGNINGTTLALSIRYAIERKRSERRLMAAEVGYRRLFQTAQDGIFILDADTGQITDANPFIEALLGCPRTELVGKRLWEIAAFRDKAASEAAFHALHEKGYIRYENLPLLNGEGRPVVVEFVSNVYTVGEKRVIQCNLRDITERKSVEAQLHFQKALLEAQSEASPDGVLAISEAGEILSYNQNYLKMWSIPAEVAASGDNARFQQVVLNQVVGSEKVLEKVQQIYAREEEPSSDEIALIDGRTFDRYSAPILSSDGLYYGRIWYFRDITDRKEVTHILHTTLIQLERSNRDLQDFASIASHDLQEPLRAIQAFSDRLQTKHGEGLNEEARDYLTRMQNAAGRMRSLIQDLLTFSRVTTQARVPTAVNLPATIQAILADLAVRLEETGGRVDVTDLPVVEADALQMRQLFQNLIANGLKFHRENEPPVLKIYTRLPPFDGAAADRAAVHIVVEDNGIGFDKKFVDRIFAPFERLHNQNRYSGTGMGLAICRKIVEWHGGTIMAQSEPGQGSKFFIELPLRQPRPDLPAERAA